MELGLSTDEEVRHLDHMVSQEQWRELIGDLGEFYLLDTNISQIVSRMRRHGACYRKFCRIALGYTPMATANRAATARSP